MSMVNTYWIDHKDQIIGVSRHWDQFALENNGEKAVSANVVGHDLWEFIKGEKTRSWLRTLLQLSRLNGLEVERPYRCDAPSEQRSMTMRLQPEGNGILAVSHTVLKTRRTWPEIDFEFDLSKKLASHTRCSICNRLKGRYDWEEPGDLYFSGQIEISTPILVLYEVCDRCWELLPENNPTA